MLYSLLLVVVRPLVHLRLLWRARANPDYALRKQERFGHSPESIPSGAVWFHTVSAGETIAAAPLIRKLTADLAEQQIPVLVTTMTPTGSAEVTRLLSSVAHCYAPYDFADAVKRFLDRTEPRMLVLMETEIWPNLIGQCEQRNIPVSLINARLSARSARGYSRVRSLLAPALRGLGWIACQYPADAQRFRELGASDAQIEVVGNLKFDVEDIPVSEQQLEHLQLVSDTASLPDRPVWIAGSTHKGEDPVLLEAHRQLLVTNPDACLLLVPRHPERFDAVYTMAVEGFSTVRLSHWLAPGASKPQKQQPQVIVVDLMGFLRPLYQLADLGFIGGSLVDAGGHNPIEAAVAGLPLFMGPGRHNFEAVCDRFVQAGALHMVLDSKTLCGGLQKLFSNESERRLQGEQAAAVVAANAGATQRLRRKLARVATGTSSQ